MVSKPKLLLVDGDARTRRVLEVSLRKAGFLVTAAQDASDALQKAQLAPPDLVISDTQLPGDDGFALCQRLKADPSLTSIPFIFLTKQRSIEDKIRGLELGVEEYLTKPIFVKEIVVRIKMLLQRRQRESIAGRDGRATTFSGDLADMAAVDLIQTLELGRKSGIIHFRDDENRSGAIYFRDGKIIDAELGQHQGERAVYRLLLWSEGRFDVEFRTIRRREVIESSNQALLMEGMRRVDEWGRLLEQLPPLESVFEVDFKELGERLGEIPDEMNAVIKLIDGRRTIPQVIDNSAFGDLETLQVISSLFFEGVVFEKRVPSQPTPPWPHVTSDLVDDAGSAVVPGADDTTSSIVRHLEGSNAADDVWDSPTIDTLETSAVPPPRPKTKRLPTAGPTKGSAAPVARSAAIRYHRISAPPTSWPHLKSSKRKKSCSARPRPARKPQTPWPKPCSNHRSPLNLARCSARHRGPNRRSRQHRTAVAPISRREIGRCRHLPRRAVHRPRDTHFSPRRPMLRPHARR